MDLKKTQSKFTKKYGIKSTSLASDARAFSKIAYGLSPQSLCLDLAIGRPGFPAGRLTEVVGLTHTGKSTLLYHVFGECQRLGGVSVLIETEYAYEAGRLEELGVKSSDVMLLQPECLEQAFEMIYEVMHDVRDTQKFKGPVVIGLDTIAGTPAAVELDGNYDEKFMAAAARSTALGLRKLIRPLAEYQVVLIFLNQLRSSMERYGDPYVSYGGKAIGSSSSVRVRLTTRKADLVKVGGLQTGAWTTCYTIKNKLAAPFQLAKYLLNFKDGIDHVEDLWRASIELKLLKPSKNAFKLTIGKKSALIEKAKFGDFVLAKFKTTQSYKDTLLQLAYEAGRMKPYGGQA